MPCMAYTASSPSCSESTCWLAAATAVEARPKGFIFFTRLSLRCFAITSVWSIRRASSFAFSSSGGAYRFMKFATSVRHWPNRWPSPSKWRSTSEMAVRASPASFAIAFTCCSSDRFASSANLRCSDMCSIPSARPPLLAPPPLPAPIRPPAAPPAPALPTPPMHALCDASMRSAAALSCERKSRKSW